MSGCWCKVVDVRYFVIVALYGVVVISFLCGVICVIVDGCLCIGEVFLLIDGVLYMFCYCDLVC